MLWYRVIPSLCKRVTPKYSLCCQIAPLKGAIFLNSLDGILRTGWSVYTGWIFFHWRQKPSVKSYHRYQQLFHLQSFTSINSMQLTYMNKCTLRICKALALMCCSWNNHNVITCPYTIVIESARFSYKPRETMPDNTIPDLLTHRYTYSGNIRSILQNIHDQIFIGIRLTTLIYLLKIDVFFQSLITAHASNFLLWFFIEKKATHLRPILLSSFFP